MSLGTITKWGVPQADLPFADAENQECYSVSLENGFTDKAFFFKDEVNDYFHVSLYLHPDAIPGAEFFTIEFTISSWPGVEEISVAEVCLRVCHLFQRYLFNGDDHLEQCVITHGEDFESFSRDDLS
ncbi:hypothetical protein [Paenibacillus chitinolyticus]|uniref:hypothetical protein n=1 Tax=Paenibacillus chitinolyticus TaxID=79263 RepID=UPI001C45C178|nr:hypothetical protein [Paenibacillus chitinolyticus]MBV6717155.1 hypothetical protein [Paenibacillus chitinolyticus]